MASSASSNVFFVFSLLLISIFVLILLRRYLPLRSSPAYLLTPIFLALFLPTSIILLVPIDLASTTNDTASTHLNPTHSVWLPAGFVLVAWRLAYWLTFSLTWVILPLLGEYTDSGARTTQAKLFYSLKSNARYQLIVLGCGVAGLGYLFWSNGFNGQSVKSLVMALAYFWALAQAVYVMGHGLVAVPRGLWRDGYGGAGAKLRRVEENAKDVHEKMEDALLELRDLEGVTEALSRKRHGAGITTDQKEWIEELADGGGQISALPYTVSGRLPTSAAGGANLPATITDGYLADLGRRLTRARHKSVRFIDAWARVVQGADDLQRMLDAKASHQLEFFTESSSPTTTRSVAVWDKLSRANVLNPRLRYYLHVGIIPNLKILTAALLSIASICIIWTEIFKVLFPKISVIRYTVVSWRISVESDEEQAPEPQISLLGQLFASIWLLYMVAAALSTLPSLKIWGNRALVIRNTYPESACWYASMVARLTVPLAYNFITTLPREVHRETIFYKFLGQFINLSPLGQGVDYIMPALVLVPALAATFNLYGRIGRWVGRGLLGDLLDIDDQEHGAEATAGSGAWREGRDLIQRELQGREDGRSVALLDGRASLDSTRGSVGREGNHTSTSAPYTDDPAVTIDSTDTPRRSTTSAPARPSDSGGRGRPLKRAQRSANPRWHLVKPNASQPPRARRGGGRERLRRPGPPRQEHIRHHRAAGMAARLLQEPKWMGGAGIGPGSVRPADNSDRGGSSRPEIGRTLSRLFGGSSQGGNVRL